MTENSCSEQTYQAIGDAGGIRNGKSWKPCQQVLNEHAQNVQHINVVIHGEGERIVTAAYEF